MNVFLFMAVLGGAGVHAMEASTVTKFRDSISAYTFSQTNGVKEFAQNRINKYAEIYNNPESLNVEYNSLVGILFDETSPISDEKRSCIQEVLGLLEQRIHELNPKKPLLKSTDSFVDSLVRMKGKKNLYIGVANSEYERINDPSAVYFSNNNVVELSEGKDRSDMLLKQSKSLPQDARNFEFLEQDHPFICKDFNDLEVLKTIADHLQFEKIIVDESTLKFAKWSDEHIKLFSKMLKPGGQFIYDLKDGSTMGNGGIGFYIDSRTGERKEAFYENLTAKVQKYFDVKISDVFPINPNYTKKRVRDLEKGEGVVVATKK